MNIAMYIRLSEADDETGFSKVESDSIANQRMCLNRYLDQDKVLSKHNRFEFCDDGFSATNSNRPNFMKMMDRVQAGEIKTIIVRDFSRFFRDYIEAGNYLECVFPFLDVRFISVNDNYDSNDYKGTTGGLEMVMRNIIYASYSKDLSVKVKTAMHHMMKQGKYVGSTPPYGYIMHKSERNKLAVDEAVVHIVKRIFAEAVSGKKITDIANDLNLDNIATPAQRFNELYPNNNTLIRTSLLSKWDYKKVYDLLHNKVYIGTLVSGKKTRAGIATSKMIKQEPFVIENTHEAIVSKEDFEKAKLVINRCHKRKEKTIHEYPLKTLLKCGSCKRTMRRRDRKEIDNYFTCSHRKITANIGCHSKRVEEKEIEKIVYNAISQYVSILQDRVPIKADKEVKVLDVVAELSLLDSQIDSLKSYKIRLYENFTSGEMTKEMFLKQKAEADKKISDIEVSKTEIEENLNSANSTEQTGDEQVDNLLAIFSKDNELTYEMAHSFINAVYIYDDNNIEIEWKFKDVFTEV